MRTILSILILAIALSVEAMTPFYFQGNNSDGSSNTNYFVTQLWPPITGAFEVYGTNIVYGGPVTNVPNASGFKSNSLYAGSYRVFYPDLNNGFFVSITDTTNYLSLATYATSVPTITGTYLFGYSLVTNWLSFGPATNSYAGILAALGYFPATNAASLSYSLLPWTPPTNSFTGLTFILGYTPATNTQAGLVSTLGFSPATNSNAGIKSAIGYFPMTNLVFSTNFTFLNGTTNPSTAYVTNGLIQRISTP